LVTPRAGRGRPPPPEPAVADGGSERRDDESAVEPRGKLDRRLGERADIGRDRPLDRLRRDAHIVECVVLAAVRDAILGRPQLAHYLESLVEDALIIGE